MLNKIELPVRSIKEFLPQFHMLFDAAQIGITVTDQVGTIIYVNKALCEIDGMRPEHALGRRMYEVYCYTADDSPTMRTLRSGKAIVDRVHYYRTRRGRLVSASCAIYPLFARGVLLGAMCYTQSYSAHEMHVQRIRSELAAREEGQASSGQKNDYGKAHYSFGSLVGSNKGLQDSIGMARLAAQNASAVMLVGETGVGKEIFAQSIHYEGPRKKGPYTAVNCSAVPETLLEGILFGTTKGSFTGATDKPGLFEASDKGTLFFDEVDSMPVGLQSKLLRVLQEKRVRRVGDARERLVDVRIISSVGRNPLQLVTEGLLRSDFYYRLGVVKIFIPPLRERMDDLHPLILHFLRKHSAALARAAPPVAPEAMVMLAAHSWPGNVRELEHALEAALNVMGEDGSLEAAHLRRACPDIADAPLLTGFSSHRPGYGVSAGKKREEKRKGTEPVPGSVRPFPQSLLAPVSRTRDFPGNAPPANHTENFVVTPVLSAASGTSLFDRRQEMEIEAICAALASTAGQRSTAARLLGISPQLLYYKIKKYGIAAEEFRPAPGA